MFTTKTLKTSTKNPTSSIPKTRRRNRSRRQPAGIQSGTTRNERPRCMRIFNAFEKPLSWLRSDLFVPSLKNDLFTDAQALMKVLKKCGEWHPRKIRSCKPFFNSSRRNIRKKSSSSLLSSQTRFAIWADNSRHNNIRAAASPAIHSTRPLRLAIQPGE